MDGKITAMHGYYWANKTLWSVYQILKDLDIHCIVFTNIKFNTNYIEKNKRNNLYYFDGVEVLHDILTFAWIFAQKISDYNEKAILNNTSLYPRNHRPKIKVYFDEMGIFANSSEYQEFHRKFGKDLTKFILQIRKLNVDIQFLIQKPEKLVKELRQYVGYWITPEPLFPNAQKILWLWFLKNCKKYYWEMRDDDGKLIIEDKIQLDTTTGNFSTYKKPLRWHYMYILRVPYYYDFYDDLFLNLPLKGLEFKTDYLITSNFLRNVYLGKINNSHLLNNKQIYDELAIANYKDVKAFTTDCELNKKPRFFDNPFYYYIHFLYKFKQTWFFKFINNFYFKFFLFFILLYFLIYKL